MIHSVRPAKPNTNAFTDLIEALASTIQMQINLFEMDRSDSRRRAALEAKTLEWIDANEIAASFAILPSTSIASECRKVMAKQILQVMRWEVCDQNNMVAAFLEAAHAANAMEKETEDSAELTRALEVLDALIELQTHLLGMVEPVSQTHQNVRLGQLIQSPLISSHKRRSAS